MIFAPPQIPSYAQGFARSAAESANPGLWDGLIGSWAPTLGVTGLTLKDQSGFGNHGTLTNGPTWVTGPDGNATQFVLGSSQRAEVSKNLYAAEQTVSVRFRPDALNTLDAVINWSGSAGTEHGGILMHSNGSFYNVHHDKFKQTGVGLLVVGEWIHIVGVYEVNLLSAYVGGVLIDSAEGANATNATVLNTLRIADQVRASNFGSITVGSAALWSRTLAFNEIQQLYVDPHALFRMRRRVFASVGAPPAGNAPTSHLYGPLVGSLGGPV